MLLHSVETFVGGFSGTVILKHTEREQAASLIVRLTFFEENQTWDLAHLVCVHIIWETFWYLLIEPGKQSMLYALQKNAVLFNSTIETQQLT